MNKWINKPEWMWMKIAHIDCLFTKYTFLPIFFFVTQRNKFNMNFFAGLYKMLLTIDLGL